MRPTIQKHKWWRFWRRGRFNPFRWEIPEVSEDFVSYVRYDGMYTPNDGLGGSFSIIPRNAKTENGETIIHFGDEARCCVRDRTDNRKWYQKKARYWLISNPFYQIHSNDIKWFGCE